MSKENTTTYIILGLLSHEDLSGYDLKKKIDLMISSFWNVGYGQIYPTLKDMEQQKYVRCIEQVSLKGPDKKLYSITDAGRNKLIEWLKIPNEKERVKYDILLKLFFGSQLDISENEKRIESFKDRNTQNLGQIKLFKENLEKVFDDDVDHLYFYLTVLFGEHIYKAYLDWAEEALSLMDKLKSTENRSH